MTPQSTLIIFATVACFLTNVRGDGEHSQPAYLSLLTQRIDEQIYGLESLQYRPLGNTPIEVGLKVIANAFELFAIASGTRFLIPKTWPSEENQVTAIACTNLCANLSTMREMYRAVVNATLFTGAEMLLEPGSENGAPERLFEILESFVNASSALKEIYNEEKTRVHEKPLPPLAEGTIDFKHIVPLQAVPTLFAIFNAYPRLRYFAINTLFALWTNEDLANGNMRQRHFLAKSLVTLSFRSKNSDKVQKLFAEAIEETAAKLDPTTINFGTIMNIGEILSSTLRKVFAEDMQLERELEDVMNAQLQRENEVFSNATNEN